MGSSPISPVYIVTYRIIILLYIFGIDISSNKRNPLLRIALTRLHGIGQASALDICKQMEVKPTVRLSDLTEIQIAKLCKIIEMRYVIESELRKNISEDIGRLVSINSYRGKRHLRGMPVNGQRTHTNRKTAKRLNPLRARSKKK